MKNKKEKNFAQHFSPVKQLSFTCKAMQNSLLSSCTLHCWQQLTNPIANNLSLNRFFVGKFECPAALLRCQTQFFGIHGMSGGKPQWHGAYQWNTSNFKLTESPFPSNILIPRIYGGKFFLPVCMVQGPVNVSMYRRNASA